jgi:hypothetical protein
MTLLLALAVTLLVEFLSALTLLAVSSRLRLASEMRQGIEAELVLTTAIAEFRVAQAAALNAVIPGETAVLPTFSYPAGWQAVATASRFNASSPLVLDVRVRRTNTGGELVAGRRGTLLLRPIAADTAFVIGNWPRY